MAIYEFGDVRVDTLALPLATVEALLRPAIAHKMHNEVASAVTARIRNELGAPDAPTDAVAAWREANADQVAAWTASLRQELLQSMLDGSIAVAKTRGPRLDPVEKKFAELVLKHAKAQVKKMGKTLPANDETVLDFGKFGTRTRSQIIDNVRNGAHAAELRKQAEKAVAEEARLEKRLVKEAAPDMSPEELGI